MSALLCNLRRRARQGHQRGVSLIFALIALAVLSLAAVALVRSVDTSTVVLGNLGFKQDAVAAADQGVEQAITWLAANIAATDNNAPGYLASYVATLDATGSHSSNAARTVVDWDGDNCASYPGGTYVGCITPKPGADVNGNHVQFVMMRLCPNTGAANTAGNDCASPIAGGVTSGTNGESANRGAFDYRRYGRFTPNSTPGGGAIGVYFRIIVRTAGAKNAVGFTDAVVHF